MKKNNIFTILIILISLVLILIGIILGDLKTGIIEKAISICLECIGIG